MNKYYCAQDNVTYPADTNACETVDALVTEWLHGAVILTDHLNALPDELEAMVYSELHNRLCNATTAPNQRPFLSPTEYGFDIYWDDADHNGEDAIITLSRLADQAAGVYDIDASSDELPF